MPQFFIQLRQATDEGGATLYKWSNTFYIIADEVEGAAELGEQLWVDHLRDASFDSAWLYQVYARDLAEDTDIFTTLTADPATARGSISAGVGSERYLRAAVASVTIPVSGSRPSRKFWRPPLYEGVVVGGVSISTTITDAIKTAFDNAISAFAGDLVDPQGQPLNVGAVIRLGVRRLGDEATADLPAAPPVG